MTTISKSSKGSVVEEDAINLALKSAHNKSHRAAVGWALLDRQHNLIEHGSIMSGIEIKQPAMAVARHHTSIHQLILTSEPSSQFFASTLLMNNLLSSSCSRITVAHKLDDDLVDSQWRDWLSGWKGSVSYPRPSGMASNLTAGMTRVKRFQRPWVTAVTAATFDNQSAPLVKMANEFGFQAQMASLLSQSRAHLVEPAQREILTLTPEANNMDELIEIYETADLQTIRTLLRYCANEYKCSLVISCHMELLAELVEAELVDEIIHHISIAGASQQNTVNTPRGLNLEKWNLVSTNAMGNCIRMRLERAGTHDVNINLRGGLH